MFLLLFELALIITHVKELQFFDFQVFGTVAYWSSSLCFDFTYNC